jgi:hypothetical protein
MANRDAVAAQGSGTTRRILVRASEVFARRGYAFARVRALVDRAPVNPAEAMNPTAHLEPLIESLLRPRLENVRDIVRLPAARPPHHRFLPHRHREPARACRWLRPSDAPH